MKHQGLPWCDIVLVMNEAVLAKAQDVIVRADLEAKFKAGKKLRVKLGIDPTGPRIHIGYASTVRHLQKLQAAGHKIVLIVGDFTAKVGDSSDKTAERPILTDEEIKANLASYKQKLSTLIDLDKAEFHYNSQWLGKLKLADVIELAQQFTVAQMIERDNFQQRYEGGKRIGLHEFLYPLLQGYDSVAIKADLEIGATEQLFNLMAGRVLQKQAGQQPQNVMTFEILVGTDGRKMSKSWGNCIWIDDEAADMYGKVMSLPDNLIVHYYRVATDIEAGVIEELEKTLAAGANPRDAKASLAREIVTIYHNEADALAAEDQFNRQFRDKQAPDEIPAVAIKVKDKISVVDGVLVEAKLATSRSEARRFREQGGVRVNGQKVTTESHIFKAGDVLQVGKRRFVRLK